jgi:hypothetical protein
MSMQTDERERFEKALRYAFDKGELVIRCVDRTEALMMRSKFYTYFKWLERQARYKRDIEKVRNAKELLEMRNAVTMGAYKNGELIIKKGGMIRALELLDDTLAHPDTPSMRDLMIELEGVSEQVMLDALKRKKKMQELQEMPREPFTVTEEEQAEIEAMKKEWDKRDQELPYKPIVLTRKELQEGEMTRKELWGED